MSRAELTRMRDRRLQGAQLLLMFYARLRGQLALLERVRGQA